MLKFRMSITYKGSDRAFDRALESAVGRRPVHSCFGEVGPGKHLAFEFLDRVDMLSAKCAALKIARDRPELNCVIATRRA